MKRDALAQPMARHVAPGDRERAGRQVDRVDPGAREGQRGQDGETARAGAEVEHVSNFAGIADRQGAVGQKIADEGARDQRPPVDVEAHAVHVGRAQQVGRRHAQRHAGVDQGEQPRPFGGGRFQVEPRVQPVDRQPQRLQDQECRLVDGVGGAVAVGQAGGAEAADREPEEIAQGDERGFVGGRHAGLDYLT